MILNGLGFETGPVNGELNEATRDAVAQVPGGCRAGTDRGGDHADRHRVAESVDTGEVTAAGKRRSGNSDLNVYCLGRAP